MKGHRYYGQKTGGGMEETIYKIEVIDGGGQVSQVFKTMTAA